MATIDVHQHLWPTAFVEALRRRTRAPMLRGWTLHTDGEAPYEVDGAAHDPNARAALDPDTDRILVSLSTPLGIERLPPSQAQPLLDAWHDGAAALPAPFEAWAAVSSIDPELDGLGALLAGGFVGLQVGAGDLASPAAVEKLLPVLYRCQELDRPVLVHPGPVENFSADSPPWWAPVVQYAGQLQAAWWAWSVAGRSSLPTLRICFAAGAGLAPVHHERFSARGGGPFVVDPDVFVETSSYGRQGVDALTRALGIDVVVVGSDRPYAAPVDVTPLGAAAVRAVREANPARLLEGARP